MVRAGSCCLWGGGEEECESERESRGVRLFICFSLSRSCPFFSFVDILKFRKENQQAEGQAFSIRSQCLFSRDALFSRTMMLQSAVPVQQQLRRPALSSSTNSRGRSSSLTTRALFGKESESARNKRLEKEEQFRLQQEVLQSRRSGAWKKVRKREGKGKRERKRESMFFFS